jgi:hypothetical protein
MPKGQQRGNKEAKKAKKATVPPPMAAGPAAVPAQKGAPPRSLKK